MSDVNGFAVSAFAAYNVGKKNKLLKNLKKKTKNGAQTSSDTSIKILNGTTKSQKKKAKKGLSPKSTITQLVSDKQNSLTSPKNINLEPSKLQSFFKSTLEVNSEEDFQPPKPKKRKNSVSSNTTTSSTEKSKKKKRKANFDCDSELEIITPAPTESNNFDSYKRGEDVFKWIIDPISVNTFFKETWEKSAIHVNRHGDAAYFQSLLSSTQIDQILRNNTLYFGRNIDVTSFTNDERQTHNPECRALPPVVWDYYSNGCSIRMLNPQTYSKKLHQAISYLQEFFGVFVGANAYLTPEDSQGFAPHYDDIEAFILQIEGKKHWKLYAPSNPEDILPRFSSPNFSEKDLPEPTMEVTLQAGDLLYFPRGTIHQGKTVPGEHSLHVTLSFYQKTSWTDYLEKLLPAALKIASKNDPEFREGLPLHFTDFMGEAHSKKKSQARDNFCKKLESLIYKLFVTVPLDTTADEFGKQFQHDALPPVLTSEEKLHSAYGDGERMGKNGRVENRVEFSMDSEVKLLRKNIFRLAKEDGACRIYHHAYNSKVYHEEEPQYFEIENSMVAAIEVLIRRYPAYTKIETLPDIDNSTNTIALISDLWERGLLLTKEPLTVLED